MAVAAACGQNRRLARRGRAVGRAAQGHIVRGDRVGARGKPIQRLGRGDRLGKAAGSSHVHIGRGAGRKTRHGNRQAELSLVHDAGGGRSIAFGDRDRLGRRIGGVGRAAEGDAGGSQTVRARSQIGDRFRCGERPREPGGPGDGDGGLGACRQARYGHGQAAGDGTDRIASAAREERRNEECRKRGEPGAAGDSWDVRRWRSLHSCTGNRSKVWCSALGPCRARRRHSLRNGPAKPPKSNYAGTLRRRTGPGAAPRHGQHPRHRAATHAGTKKGPRMRPLASMVRAGATLARTCRHARRKGEPPDDARRTARAGRG